MEIVGTVVSVSDKKAIVKVKRVSACGDSCASCKGGCETTSATSVAENLVGAKVGDTVKIESDTKSIIQAAVALYMAPVLIAIFTAVIAYGINLSNIFVIILSGVSFFASFFVIKFFEKRLTPKSYITKILGKA